MILKVCVVCGNDIPNREMVCHFCESLQPRPLATRAAARVMSTVDLEAGRPTVKEALQHFDARLASERMLGVRLIKVIHGYGSSGVGGATKTQLHRHLEALQKSGQIKAFVRGEEYSQMTAAGRKLLNDFPELKNNVRSDSGNPGITFVILRS